MTLVADLKSHFRRIEGETSKAASYLTMSRAVVRVPDSARRWTESEVREALQLTRDGLHMAFVVTLSATFQNGRGLITIPNLLRKLRDGRVQHALANARQLPRDHVQSNVRDVERKLARIKRLAIYDRLKTLRDNVVAHHSADIDSHKSTQGPLNRLMVRTVYLVDDLGTVINGEATTTAAFIRHLLQQSAAFWSHGMDADPYGDLEEQ